MVSTPYGDVHERFLAMEADLDLFSFTLDGIRIWEWIRYDVFQDVMFSTGVWHHHEPLGRGLADRLKGGYLLARNAAVRNPFLSSGADLLFYGHPRRMRMDDGYWWDIYCDPIHEAAEMDYLHVEDPFLNRHFRPARTENLRYLDLIHYAGTLREELGLVDGLPRERERCRLDETEERIRVDFGIDVDVTGKAHTKLERHNATAGLYDRFLGRIDPDLVVLVAGSGRETFIRACKRRGIPVAELQHGHISEYSIEYSFPGDREKQTFPDYLLTFGEFWNHTGAYPTDPGNVIDVGYPYLEWSRERYAGVVPTDQILFMSQWMITPKLSRFAVELSALTSRDVAFKLHPDEYERWEKLYPWLADSDVDVIGPNGPPLHRLLAESSVQVGVYSTTIFEGLSFGLDTYLVELPGVEHMVPLIDRGDATLVDSPEQLHEAVKGASADRGARAGFFREDSLERAEQVIRDLQVEARSSS
ncbi:MAG: hypothetical protein V5A27_09020 [Halapricum sp.]